MIVVIDIERLLQPIAPDAPCGPDLRLVSSDLTFGKLTELRREADAETDAGGEARTADWKGVARESEQALREKSKDLQLAAILTQGLVGTQGYPGLAAGLRLIRELIGRYWDTLHPGCEDGEIILPIRARPLAWLGSSREFLTTVKRVPMAGGGGAPARTWLDFEQSRRVDEAGTRADQQAYRELIETGLITGEQWRAALAATPPAQLAAAAGALREGLAELEALTAVCAEKFGDEAPALIELRNLLGDCLGHLEGVLSGDGAAASAGVAGAHAPGAAAVVGGGAVMMSGGASSGGGGGPIATREQAYQQLREVAEYLRRTEPHSPVALLIDRAVKWERLTFAALFEDVVKNREARSQLAELLGLKQENES